MSNITNDKLLETVNETVDWASELGETFLATTTGRVLDNQRDELLRVVKSGDLELADVLVFNLAQTCTYAEEELARQEINES